MACAIGPMGMVAERRFERPGFGGSIGLRDLFRAGTDADCVGGLFYLAALAVVARVRTSGEGTPEPGPGHVLAK